MTAPLNVWDILGSVGVSTNDVQDFALKYAAAWASVPARLQRVAQVAESGTGSARDSILAATENLQSEYAAISANVSALLAGAQGGGSVNVPLAVATIPQALAVLQGTDQVEQAVGIPVGTPVATVTVPWWVWAVPLGVVGFLVWRMGRRR